MALLSLHAPHCRPEPKDTKTTEEVRCMGAGSRSRVLRNRQGFPDDRAYDLARAGTEVATRELRSRSPCAGQTRTFALCLIGPPLLNARSTPTSALFSATPHAATVERPATPRSMDRRPAARSQKRSRNPAGSEQLPPLAYGRCVTKAPDLRSPRDILYSPVGPQLLGFRLNRITPYT